MSVEKGLSVFSIADANCTGALVKATAGKVMSILVSNNAASARWLRLYNKATAPTNADTPVMRMLLTANMTTTKFDLVPPADSTVEEQGGALFSTGIGVRCSTNYVDADNSAPTAGDVQLNVLYH